MEETKKKLVLFDYGGVIGRDHQEPAESKLMAFFGVDKKTMQSVFSLLDKA